MKNETKGMLLGLIGITSFGLTLPATRFAVEYFSPLFIGLGRAVLAGGVAALLLIVTKQRLPNQRQMLKLTGVALGVVVAFPVLSAVAMRTVPASRGGVVLGVLPLATAVAGSVLSKEKPSFAFWSTGVLGCALVVAFSLRNGAEALSFGDLALVGAIIGAAVGYALGGQLSKEMGGWKVICWALVISLPFIFVPALLQAPENGTDAPIGVWAVFLYLALVSQLLGFFFWNKGLALGGVARVSQAQLIQPFVTLIASALFIGEKLETETLIFAALVVGVVALGKKMPIGAKTSK